MAKSQFKLHPIISNFPARVSHFAVFGTLFIEDRIRVIHVNQNPLPSLYLSRIAQAGHPLRKAEHGRFHAPSSNQRPQKSVRCRPRTFRRAGRDRSIAPSLSIHLSAREEKAHKKSASFPRANTSPMTASPGGSERRNSSLT